MNLLTVLGVVLLLIGGCRYAKVNRDLTACWGYAFDLASYAEIYRHEHDEYPKSMVIFIESSELEPRMTLPESGRHIEFVYGVESGHEFLFAASKAINGHWVVVYPNMDVRFLDVPPFAVPPP